MGRYWNELTFSENAIEWLRGENMVTCTFCSGGRLNNRLRKLAQERPEDVEIIENDDGTVYGKVPVSWLKISPPRQMSEEERARAAENLRRNLDNFRGKSGQKPRETC